MYYKNQCVFLCDLQKKVSKGRKQKQNSASKYSPVIKG